MIHTTKARLPGAQAILTGSMIEWLRTQVDDDEQAALAPLNTGVRTATRYGGPPPPHWVYEPPQIRDPGNPGGVVVTFVHARKAAHITRHDPARVLREIAFKRTVRTAHSSVLAQRIDGVMREACVACHCELVDFEYPCPPLRQLAAV